MMLSVRQPLEPTWPLGSGGRLMRSPSRCWRHRVPCEYSLKSPHFVGLDRWRQWNPLYSRYSLNDLPEQLTSFHSMINMRPTLDDLFQDSRRFRTVGLQKTASCQAVYENNNMLGTGLVNPMKWQLNSTKKEARAEVKLPCGLRKSDDLNVELDEASRTITLTSTRVSGPDNRSVSTWVYSQRLDDSIDLDHLQASVDFQNGSLQLRAPLKAIESTQEVRPRLLETKLRGTGKNEEINSEEEQPPQSDIEISSENESDTENFSTAQTEDTAQRQDQPSDNVTNTENEPEIEIEDVGPDHESDRVSISSSGSAASNH